MGVLHLVHLHLEIVLILANYLEHPGFSQDDGWLGFLRKQGIGITDDWKMEIWGKIKMKKPGEACCGRVSVFLSCLLFIFYHPYKCILIGNEIWPVVFRNQLFLANYFSNYGLCHCHDDSLYSIFSNKKHHCKTTKINKSNGKKFMFGPIKIDHFILVKKLCSFVQQ